MDVEFRGSYVGIGAAAFNAQVAAARHGLLASITAFPRRTMIRTWSRHRADPSAATRTCRAVPGDDRSGSPTATTGRRRDAVRTSVTTLHRAAASAGGGRLQLITDAGAGGRGGRHPGRVRPDRGILTPLLHQQMMAELKWLGRDAAGRASTSTRSGWTTRIWPNSTWPAGPT